MSKPLATKAYAGGGSLDFMGQWIWVHMEGKEAWRPSFAKLGIAVIDKVIDQVIDGD